MEHNSDYRLPKTPNVPLAIKCNESLSFFQFRPTACTIIGIKFCWTRRFLKYFVMLLLCSGSRWISCLLSYGFLFDLVYNLATPDTFLT